LPVPRWATAFNGARRGLSKMRGEKTCFGRRVTCLRRIGREGKYGVRIGGLVRLFV
jgi:hypothetical protein